MVLQRPAEGRRVLVVEDEMTIVFVIEDALLELGAQIIGPAAGLGAALLLAREAAIDAAVLDINIRGGNSYPVADVLAERGIPFVFCSGYSEWAVEERHRGRPPFQALQFERARRRGPTVVKPADRLIAPKGVTLG